MLRLLLLGLSTLAIGFIWPPGFLPQQDSETARTKNAEIGESDDESQIAELDRTVDLWLETMREAKYIHFTAEVVRLAHFVDAPTEELSRYEIRAEAYMSRDALVLSVWEKDSGTDGHPERPNMIIRYADGQATEDLWYPQAEAYRHRTWRAPLEEGANRTAYPYPQGCMIGVMLLPWPGDGPMTGDFWEGILRSSVVEPKGVDVAGRPTVVLRNDRPENSIDEDGDGEAEYGRTDYQYFSSDGMLRRWRIVVINGLSNNGKGGRPYLIEQDEVFDIELLEDVPRELLTITNGTKPQRDQ